MIDGVAVADEFGVTVSNEGSSKLNVDPVSRDDPEAVEEAIEEVVAVIVTIKTDVFGVGDNVCEATHGQLFQTPNVLGVLTSPWGPVLVGRTGTTWHAWVYRAAASEFVALVEHASLRA